MKLLIIVLLGIVIFQSPDARRVTSNLLFSGAELISPDEKEKTIGERIDSFLAE